ncbi:hypothetical protein HY844_00485 [Candidatus Berkelbacteria bacterium]|nr:hypothetical protein [Candidatus Berkelbacteria bacterium]
MILAKLTKNNGVELSDKKNTVILEGNEISLNSEKIASSGEYESAGIEIIYGENSALVVWERIQIVSVFNNSEPTVFEKSQFSSCDVLIFGTNELNKETANSLIEAFDPKMIIFSDKSVNDGLLTVLKAQTTTSVKLSEQALSDEGREVFVLE